MTLIQGETRELCQEAVARSAELFDSLGFTIHLMKSVFAPTQTIEFLGFVRESRSMTVSLTHTQSAKLKQPCIEILQTDMVSIQSLADLIGHRVAALPGVLFDTIFIKRLEILKIKSLAKKNIGSYAICIRL